MFMEQLKVEAGEALFDKAVSHYRSGNIKSYSFSGRGKSNFKIKAIVQAAGAFGVTISLSFDTNWFEIDHYCTCAANGARLCEHAAAVIYKFLADDFPKINRRPMQPAEPQGGIAQLQLAVAPAEPAVITYAIHGLGTTTEFFQLTPTVPQRDKAFCGQLVECLGDINYSAWKREELLQSLSGFDRLVFCFLENKLSRKELSSRTVFLPKSRESLQLIVTLSEAGRAVVGETGQPLQLGEPLAAAASHGL
ncbi:MAG: hypothetical protein PVG90_11105 [Bacillota bacterium]